MSLQIATLDYEIKGNTPRDAARNLTNYMMIADNDGGMRNDGRSYVCISSDRSYVEPFKQSVKAYRKGNVNRAEISFPIRIGKVAYINVIPTATHLNILFRHDSCIANNYHSDDYDGDEIVDEHYQPQVYFIVKIQLSDGSKDWRVVQSPVAVRGRMFPHNESHGQTVVSSCCAGDYTDQIVDALRSENLSAFLTLVSMYISDGTRSTDEYGRSCGNFTKNRDADREVHYTLENALNARLLAYTMSDPELPHGLKMTHQKRTFTFSKPEFQEVYFNSLCELASPPPSTTEVTL